MLNCCQPHLAENLPVSQPQTHRSCTVRQGCRFGFIGDETSPAQRAGRVVANQGFGTRHRAVVSSFPQTREDARSQTAASHRRHLSFRNLVFRENRT
jgi:hypothetical protein